MLGQIYQPSRNRREIHGFSRSPVISQRSIREIHTALPLFWTMITSFLSLSEDLKIPVHVLRSSSHRVVAVVAPTIHYAPSTLAAAGVGRPAFHLMFASHPVRSIRCAGPVKKDPAPSLFRRRSQSSEARRCTHRTYHRPTATRPMSMCRRLRRSPRYGRTSTALSPTAFTQRSGGVNPWQLLNGTPDTVRPCCCCVTSNCDHLRAELSCRATCAHELYTHANALCDAVHGFIQPTRNAVVRVTQLSAPPSL